MALQTVDPSGPDNAAVPPLRSSNLLDEWRKARKTWLKDRPVRAVVVLVSLYAASYLPIAFLFEKDIPWGVGLSIVTLPILAAWLLSDVLTYAFRNRKDNPVAAWLLGGLAVVALIGIGVVVWLAATGRPTQGFGFVAFVTGVVVLGGLVTWLRQFLADRKFGAKVTVVGILAVAAIGFILPPSTLSFWLMIGGTLLMPVGVAVASEIILRETATPPADAASRSWWWAGGAVVLTVGALLITVWLDDSLPNMPFGLLFAIAAGAILLLLLLITADNVVDLLLVALALSFVAFYQNAEVPADPFEPTGDERTLVALGDSYISGEGAGDFYAGTNDKGSNECRRSAHAYAELMTADELPEPARFDDVIFLACSGATAEQVTTVDQFPGIGSQLDQLQAAVKGGSAQQVGLVILSIGGNDAGFGDIGQACIIPGTCVEQMRPVLGNIANVEQELRGAYHEIRDRLVRMGITAPVLVVPYPVPIAEQGCGWSAELFDGAEHKFLYDFANTLNAAIGRAARDSDFHVLDDMAAVFVGDNRLAICSEDLETGVAKNLDELGVNFIKLGSVSGSPGQIADPRNWIHNSLHPTVDGHRALRDALAIWLQENQDLAPLTAPSGPAPQPPDEAKKVDASGWMYASLAEFLKWHLPFLYVAAAGAWLLALAIIRRHRLPGAVTTPAEPTPETV